MQRWWPKREGTMSNRRGILRKEKEWEWEGNENRNVKERRGWAKEKKGKEEKNDFIRKGRKGTKKKIENREREGGKKVFPICGWVVAQGADPLPPLSSKCSEGRKKSFERVKYLPPPIETGNRYSKNISVKCQAALLRRCEHPLLCKRKCWTNSVVLLV